MLPAGSSLDFLIGPWIDSRTSSIKKAIFQFGELEKVKRNFLVFVDGGAERRHPSDVTETVNNINPLSYRGIAI